MSDALDLWKTTHVLSAAILLGTGLGIAFFCWAGFVRAMRTSDIAGLRLVLRLTVLADACFTAPAVVFQVVSGLVLMQLHGWSHTSPWSIAVWSLFILTGVCWVPVIFMQIWLSREADRVPSMDALPPRFHRWFRLWFVLGVPAFAAVVLLFYLMIAKPLAISSA